MPNADNAKQFVEQAADLWRKRRTFKGLVGLSIILNSMLLCFVLPGAYFILTKTDVITIATHYAIFFVYCALFVGLANLLLFCTWAYWRTLPVASDGKPEILFAPHADEEASDLVYRLYKELCEDIAARQMQHILKCRHLSENHMVRNHADAHELVIRSGARLVIYGTVAKGKIKGDDVEGFRTISFTVRHRNLSPNERTPVMKNLAAAFAFRTFCVKNKNSFIEHDVVIRNISEVTRFFIGLGLTLDDKLEEPLSLLEPLLKDVEKKAAAQADNPQLALFSESIKSCLTFVLQATFNRTYEAGLIDHITQREYDPQARECEGVLNKLLALDKRTSSFYLGRAIIRFHFDDIDGAFAAADHAKRLAPFNNAAPHLSLAFLHLWRKNYRRAFMQYMRAGKCKDCNIQTVTSALQFLNTMALLNPDRQELLFALAFVNDQFFDQNVALRDYQTFLTSKSAEDLSEFTTFAERRIKRIRESANE